MAENEKITLSCLRGEVAPAEIVADLTFFADLPLDAKRALFDVLGPCMSEPVPADVEARLARFCGAHGASPDRVAHVVKGARFVLRQASAIELDAAHLARDLETLAEVTLAEVVLPHYQEVKTQVRAELLRGTIADHGKLVEGIDWRIDTISASDRGEGFGYAIGILTFRYRDGEKADRITLHLLPNHLAELRAMCDRMLG